jgi:putative colanic acid biosynthesis acetyltransferase WcaF
VNPKFNIYTLSFQNKIARSLWQITWVLLYRPSPKILHGWRAFLLRLFGAKIGHPVYVYPSSKIWAPWNLEMRNYSTLADGVDCYCVDKVLIGYCATVSQYSFLCTAGHDYLNPSILDRPQMTLIAAPITVGDYAWITADVYIAPGVTVSEGGVVLARSSVFQDVPPWTVVAGNPAQFKKKRNLRQMKD